MPLILSYETHCETIHKVRKTSPFLEIKTPDRIVDGLKDFLCQKGPVICEIHVDSDQELIPRMGFTIKEDGKWLAKPLEDMYPLLDRNVLKNAMCLDLWEED